MAAHAVEDEDEVEIELEDDIRVETTSTRVERGATYKNTGLPLLLPPPPPIRRSNYSVVSAFTYLLF